MATSNEEYWRKRTQSIVQAQRKAEKDVLRELGQIYTDAKETLTEDLQAFYAKYADEEGLTIAAAKRKISRKSANVFQKKITRLLAKKNLTSKEEEELRLLRAKFTVTRLDLLIHQMELELIPIYGEAQVTMEEHLKTVAAETYYETSGMVGQYARLPKAEVEQIVNFPWSGAMFSDLLWDHKDKLVKNLRKVTTIGLIRGDSIQVMARKLRDEVGNSRYAAERLIRTESCHVLTESTLKSYEKNGISKYEYNANIDEKTDEDCEHLDGGVFKISERMFGKNAPPKHPSCRCYVTPVVD